MNKVKKFTAKVRKTIKTSSLVLGVLWKVDKWVFLGNLIVFSIPSIIPFINAYIYKLIIDLIVSSVQSTNPIDYHQLLILLIFRFMTLLIQDVSFSIQTYFEQLSYYKFPAYIYQLFLSKIASLDLQYFEDSEFSNKLEKIRDSYTWRPLNVITYSFYTFQSILQVLIAVVALATLNWLFIIVVIFLALPSFITQTNYANIEWGIWNGDSPKRKRFYYISGLLQNGFNIKEIKIFQMGGKFLAELKFLYASFTKNNLKAGKRFLFINLLINLFATSVYITIEIYIILMAVRKSISIGGISYYTAVINNFQSGIGGLFRNSAQIFAQTLYVQELFDLLDTPTLIKENPKSVKIDCSNAPIIEFKNVSFTYPNTKEKIFDNFSITINSGERIAFVGENGAGKTTLIKLLARFYDVDEGEILINGINIKDVELSSWYSTLGILFQDFVRYEYSLEDNIYFGKIWEEKNLDKIKDAAKLSGADSVAQSLKNGYQQMLGKSFEDGAEISVGQWQKVALARAFLRDAPVLILDEPTASIDAKAESEIFEKVEKLSKNKSVIIISHRFSTVRNADKIYVIKKGKIIEQGSHEELMKIEGSYAKLFKLQAKGYK